MGFRQRSTGRVWRRTCLLIAGWGAVCAEAYGEHTAFNGGGPPPLKAIFGAVVSVAFLFTLWAMFRIRAARETSEQQRTRLQQLALQEELDRERIAHEETRAALRDHAVRDELTGLPNRTSIIEVLDREMARAVRDKSPMSVVLADIDHLKKINEEHGQEGGDAVLKEMGRRLAFAIRSYDTAGRYGGGEFLLVLPTFEGDTGVERLRKIHDSICGKAMQLPDGPLNVTCSFGVSILLPHEFYSSEDLRERAGQAMSTAKQDGRNRIGFFARSSG